MMNVLYATQATGNGHIARAIELIPELIKHVDLDIMISGYQSELKLPFPVKYKKRGLSFYLNQKGGIRYWKSIKNINAIQLVHDVNTFPIKSYEFIINDFEPISAWSARLHQVPCIALSHQSSFYSKMLPRPIKRNFFQELGMKYFAPADDYIGLHFENYSTRIEKPIIRSKIRSLKSTEEKHIVVYLPGYSNKKLIDFFERIPNFKFHVFSKKLTEIESPNINFHKVGSDLWYRYLVSSHAVIMGAGFEGPSEALYLGKRLIVCPLSGQYEQQCNAFALSKLGVPVIQNLSQKELPFIIEALSKDPIQIDYPNNTQQIIQRVLQVGKSLSKSDKYIQLSTLKKPNGHSFS